MKKKILSAAVCAAAILSLTACGKNESPTGGFFNSIGNDSASSTTSSTSSKPASSSAQTSKPEQSSAPESKPVSTSTQTSTKPEQSSVPESKPEESSVPETPNEVDWDSVPYADELDFEVKDVDGGVKIYNYLGSDTVIKVPETIDGKKVVVISNLQENEYGGLDPIAGNDDSVFANATHVKLPDSVSDITSAFHNNKSLVSVNIPSSLTTLSGYAFNGSSLSSIEIPNTVTEIGDGAFGWCASLKSIDIPKTVTEIGNWAFAESGLESLTVPDGVKVFVDQTIQGCADLKEVHLPKGIRATEIDMAFGEDIRKISFIDLERCSSLTNTDFLKNVKPLADDNGALIVNFIGCSGLTSVTFPDGVQVVDSFSGCENLTEITIPNSVTNVGVKYTYSVDGYSPLYFSDGILWLSGCNNLKKITLSDNLESLKEIHDCPENLEIVYKGKTYKPNQLPNLYKAINGN